MNTMKRIITLLLALTVVLGMAMPAYAEGNPAPEALTDEISEKTVGEGHALEIPHQGDADTYNASNPTITLVEEASNLTVPAGEVAVLSFVIDGSYFQEAWNVKIFDRYYNEIGSKRGEYDNRNGSNKTLTLVVDTASLGMTTGEYTVQYYLEYYVYYNNSWIAVPKKTVKLKVLENKCRGLHEYKLDAVLKESTCDKEGRGRYTCTRCGNVVHQLMELKPHTYDKGVVRTKPTNTATGVRRYTCTACGATKNEKIPALKTAPAKPNKIVNVVSGVHVYWNAVEGARKYGLWRSETGKDGTYKWVANPTVPHFTDTKVESGKTCYYKVTIMNVEQNMHTDKSEPIGITYVSTPDISARYNKAAGVKLEWQQITGATGYAIYRKSYSGTDEWVRVATISGNTTFTWTDGSVKNENGTAYKYTIRALAGADMKTLSGCRNAGRSMVRLASRVLTDAIVAGDDAIKCTWTTSSAVTGYEIRFIVDGEVYKTFTVGSYKTGVKTFTGLQAGQTYKIQIRSYKKIDGMGFYSAWSEAKTVTL